MSFTALNFSAEDAAFDAEEHTRELQIEQAFKAFQQALVHQKGGDFDQADNQFKELFKIEVITDDSRSIITPTVRTLRYLAYRNRGLLHFEELRSTIDSLPLDKALEILLSVIDDLTACLRYTDGDFVVVSLLLGLFKVIKSARLARLVIEYELTKDESKDSVIHKRNRLRNKDYLILENEERKLLTGLGISYFDITDIKSDDHDLAFLQPVVDHLFIRREKLILEQKATIKVHNPTWKVLAVELNNLLPKSKIKNSKAKDMYFFLENPITCVAFEPYGDSPTSNNLVEAHEHSEKQIGDADVDIQNDFDKPQLKAQPPVDRIVKSDLTTFEGVATSLHESSEFGNEVTQNINIGTEKFVESKPPQLPQDETEVCATGFAKDEMHQTMDKKRNSIEDIPQRSSKRVRQLTETENNTDTVNTGHESFIQNLNFYLKRVGGQFNFNITTIQTKGKQTELHLYDFYNALQSWNNKLTETLFQDSSQTDSSEIALTELFNSSTFTGGLLSDDDMKYLDDSLAADFIETHQNWHYIHLRNSFLEALLSQKVVCPITDLVFEKELYNAVETLALMSEETIFGEIKTSSSSPSTAISVFEILLNCWISLKQRSKARGLSSKQQSDFCQQIEALYPVVLRWKKYVENQNFDDPKLKYRLKWCSLLYIQHSQDSHIDEIKHKFNKFYSEIAQDSELLSIPYPNYEFIPSLTLSTIKSQNDKLNVITSFEKSLKSDDSEDTVHLLENLLLSRSTEELSEEQLSMIRFINESPIALKLKLWKILFRYYTKTSRLDSFSKAFRVVLPLLFEQVSSEDYSVQPDTQRYQILITTIAYLGDYISSFAQLLQEHMWKIENADTELLQLTLDVFRMLYPYCLFEGSFKVHNRNGSKSTARIRDIVIETLTVVFALFIRESGIKDQLEFFNVIHAEVGNMNFCDRGEGRLLKIGQHILKTADTVEFEAELLQHLNCRFHIFITSDTFIPFDHQTTKTNFKKESALEFSDYILDSILRQKNLFQSPLKPELKNALEILHQSFGDPDLEHSTYQRNDTKLHLFLETNLDLRVFRDALTGALSQQFRKSTRPEQNAFDKGLFYLEGLINLNMYRIRKKAAQAKGSDLDYIIRMFKYDLVAGSNRFETWFSLGEAYSFLVEDDLTWTADKLNSLEKKLVTANNQRRSILCYLMGVSVLASTDSAVDKSLQVALFSSLSKEVYYALYTPMNSLCLLTAPETKVLADGCIIDLVPRINEPLKLAVLKFSERILLAGITLDRSSWQNYLLLSKIRRRLNCTPGKVINAIAKSCELNNTQIETLYSLCSYLYKFVKNGKYDTKKAIDKLKKVPMFSESISSLSDEHDFNGIVIACLRRLVSVDKKKWHHKPKYRISKILFDQGDYRGAYDEIESIVVLKSTNKNLISIWKPELEPAGKHFAYTSNYIDFYLDVADKLFELQNLILFTKKLRRFGASMIDLQTHWDKAITKVCMLVKELIDAKPGYTDIEVPKLNYTELIQKSDLLINKYKDTPIREEEIPLFVLMLEIYELRKMNNGFGSTSLIDDTFNCVYLKFYLKKDEEGELQLPEKPVVVETSAKSPTVKSKVARRDILAVASNLSKVLEGKLKNERITEEKGFEIPNEIRESHLTQVLELNEVSDENKDPDNSEGFLTPSSRTPAPKTPDQRDRTVTDTPKTVQNTPLHELAEEATNQAKVFNTDTSVIEVNSSPSESTNKLKGGDAPGIPLQLTRDDTPLLDSDDTVEFHTPIQE